MIFLANLVIYFCFNAQLATSLIYFILQPCKLRSALRRTHTHIPPPLHTSPRHTTPTSTPTSMSCSRHTRTPDPHSRPRSHTRTHIHTLSTPHRTHTHSAPHPLTPLPTNWGEIWYNYFMV